jgi:hypothetical protein
MGLLLLAIFLLSVVYAAILRASNPHSEWILTPILVMLFICVPGILFLEKEFPDKPALDKEK